MKRMIFKGGHCLLRLDIQLKIDRVDIDALIGTNLKDHLLKFDHLEALKLRPVLLNQVGSTHGLSNINLIDALT